ncbi:MAG: hypothetical protein HQ495_02395 [Alphaproteobacteria bacterium]|nr:hypothetical protein [Alphaproteobacteria bacterium]
MNRNEALPSAFAETLAARRSELAAHLKLDDETEISDAVTELVSIYQRVVLYWDGVDQAPSSARLRKTLTRLHGQATFSNALFDSLGAHVQDRIAAQHPGGLFEILENGIDDAAFKAATRQALASLGESKRGRPSGTDSLAARQASLELSYYWARYRGEPTRAVRWTVEGAKAEGPFYDFMTFLLGLSPWPSRSAENFARHALAERAAAKRRYEASGNPADLWTIPEESYLEGTPNPD